MCTTKDMKGKKRRFNYEGFRLGIGNLGRWIAEGWIGAM
jgi:hypothetical protein